MPLVANISQRWCIAIAKKKKKQNPFKNTSQIFMNYSEWAFVLLFHILCMKKNGTCKSNWTTNHLRVTFINESNLLPFFSYSKCENCRKELLFFLFVEHLQNYKTAAKSELKKTFFFLFFWCNFGGATNFLVDIYFFCWMALMVH